MSEQFQRFLEWEKKPHPLTMDEIIRGLKNTKEVREIFAAAEEKERKSEERKNKQMSKKSN